MYFTRFNNALRVYFHFTLCILFFSSCKPKVNEAIVANYGEKELFWSEVSQVIPDNVSSEDSSFLANKYIKDWLTRQIIIDAADKNLNEDQLTFDQLVNEYSNSLKIHAFEEEWIRQKLDTHVTQEEILKFYEENEANFQLKQFLVKIKFTSVPNNFSQLKSLKKYFYSERPEDLVKWQQLCVSANATNFISDEEWMTWDDFLKQVPLEIYDAANFLKKKRQLEFEKDDLQYLIQFLDYKLIGSPSPIEFERIRIANLIINKRKRLLLDTMKADLYALAESEKRINIYSSRR